jgi:hypothetical protein
MKPFVKKVMLIVLVAALAIAMLPVSIVLAAPLHDDPDPQNGQSGFPRIEKGFQRVKSWYEKQGNFLDKAGQAIDKTQKLINKANEKGLNVSTVQSALDAFKATLPAVEAAHKKAGVIISAHNGLDANGKVVDAKIAAQTVKDAAAALQEGRQAHLGAGKTLREAVRTFIQANKPPRPGNGNAVPTQP